MWLSSCQVVFLHSDQTWDYHPEVYFNSGSLPLRLFSIEVVFHWGYFPFGLSSIEQVFYRDHLLLRLSSVKVISRSSSIEVVFLWVHFLLCHLKVFFHWGRLPLSSFSFMSSSIEVMSFSSEIVFHCGHFPFRSSSIYVDFHWGLLSLRLSSIEVIFH